MESAGIGEKSGTLYRLSTEVDSLCNVRTDQKFQKSETRDDFIASSEVRLNPSESLFHYLSGFVVHDDSGLGIGVFIPKKTNHRSRRRVEIENVAAINVLKLGTSKVCKVPCFNFEILGRLCEYTNI